MLSSMFYTSHHLPLDNYFPLLNDLTFFCNREDSNTIPGTTNKIRSASRSDGVSINTSSTGIGQHPPRHQIKKRRSRSRSISSNNIHRKTCHRAPGLPTPETNTCINDALFNRLPRGESANGLHLVMKNEVSYCFGPVGNATDERRDDVVEIVEIRRGNMSRLVIGQVRMYPKRRVEGRGIGEIERGAGVGKGDQGVEDRDLTELDEMVKGRGEEEAKMTEEEEEEKDLVRVVC
ncbi:hypothetical protein EPUS_08309 [Endocarpon pusillum Z07020]|uniref:Uncharacterized protein n=1 Tax=Endocarpon pusillum (strain Z07020 / HMAS-L-300199) TaxID=1263415 RepID=U1HXE3_ENDPU|nr:uncharacterized protein EPUS_08309 [Endocarpon pusillum Z07020]ERF75495.1 hypothetical protein EPUS_08309 [Endocarpon pusillum Z07020]